MNKMNKEDVYRTNNKIVKLGNCFEAQFLFKDYNKTGSYEGQNYWNCYDVYDINGIRFLYGNGITTDETKFSMKLLKDTAIKMSNIWSFKKEDIELRKMLMDNLCDSIHKGIHDPAIIKSFTGFKKELASQKQMYPHKTLTEIAGELVNYFDSNNLTKVTDEVNNGINKIITSFTGTLSKEDFGVKLESALNIIYEKELKKEQTKKISNEKKLELPSRS